MFEPNDFRDVLTIARARTLGAAARQLGLDPSTMGRRLAALEARLGFPLFLRSRDGLVPTPQGARVVQAADQLEAQRLALEREIMGQDRTLRGELRITAAEWGGPLLSAPLRELSARYPQLVIKLIIENRLLDLARREADVALRVGRPTERSLAGKRLGEVHYALYASADYLSVHGVPRGDAALRAHALCALDIPPGRMPSVRWQERLAGTARVVMRTNSMLALLEAARAGSGLAVLPAALAERYPELRRVAGEHERVQSTLWLLYHERLRESAPIRAAIKQLAAHIATFLGPPRLGTPGARAGG